MRVTLEVPSGTFPPGATGFTSVGRCYYVRKQLIKSEMLKRGIVFQRLNLFSTSQSLAKPVAPKKNHILPAAPGALTRLTTTRRAMPRRLNRITIKGCANNVS
ncbi:hypothetical protein MNBD_PLANCTO02-2850 [hydrothermal vent metagenome]|uniref:Uncharacterized protein n=1 Tax=hydrothermal vent metagenome TaxID=652676 RepID=A0A3B1E7A9_9ZZZZ